jgi:cytochrome c peroxidase
MLFFDPRLSGDDQIACATCHRPELAFSDGQVSSRGESGQPLSRHTPSLSNLAWSDAYFWDGGAKDLESQVFGPLLSPDEMGADVDTLLGELADDPEYAAAFVRAFGEAPSLRGVARAIAQFERTLIFADSRYDAYAHGDLTALSEQELTGLSLFRRHCAPCHVPELFTDRSYHNIGLDSRYAEDLERLAWGRGRITNERADIGKYKTPALRNVAVTAPYMHDGRFATLDAVLDHYRNGVERSATLDPRLVAPDGTLGIAMDDDEAAALVAFLHALTDASLEQG